MVKSRHHYYRRYEFSFQHPYWLGHKHQELKLRKNLAPSLASAGIHTHILISTHVHLVKDNGFDSTALS